MKARKTSFFSSLRSGLKSVKRVTLCGGTVRFPRKCPWKKQMISHEQSQKKKEQTGAELGQGQYKIG